MRPTWRAIDAAAVNCGLVVQGAREWILDVVPPRLQLGVHYGETFEPGKTGNMSAATGDKAESSRRGLLHEIARHLENGNARVRAIRDAAFADPRRRPITRYARQDASEYLAESLTAHIAEPESLSRHDPVGSRMIKKVLAIAAK